MEKYLYGEISRESLKEFEEVEYPLTLHINSAGGDVFSAIAIGNILRGKDVTCKIEGLCASAATLISSSCSKVLIAKNSLMMVHAPLTWLEDYYTAQELETIKTSLEKVAESIMETYKSRLKKEIDLTVETWLNAQEAVEYGLADEIDGEVELQIDNSRKMIFVNKCSFQLKRLPEVGVMEKMIERVRAEEMARIEGLRSLRSEDSAVNAIVDMAISKGRSVSEAKEYIEAVKKVSGESITRKRLTDVRDEIIAVIKDQMQSGACGVKGSFSEDELKMQRDMIAKYANEVTR